jgi:hypothetical protein
MSSKHMPVSLPIENLASAHAPRANPSNRNSPRGRRARQAQIHRRWTIRNRFGCAHRESIAIRGLSLV